MKTINDGGVSNGGDMDWSHMMFTSDFSLPKDDKKLCLGKQITAGKLTQLWAIDRIMNAPQC